MKKLILAAAAIAFAAPAFAQSSALDVAPAQNAIDYTATASIGDTDSPIATTEIDVRRGLNGSE